MGRRSTRIRGPLGRILAAVLLGTLALAGCGPRGNVVTEVGATGGTPVRGGTATMALPPASTPNWIFPIGAPGFLATYNSALQSLLFLRLFTPGEKGGALTMESPHNLAEAPRYSDGNKTVTITLKKGYAWSDGKPVTARDVKFWFTLIKHNKEDWAGYSPKLMPDDVKAFEIVDARTFRLRLDRAYNPAWFTANELENFVALPEHAWNPRPRGPEDRPSRGSCTTPVSSRNSARTPCGRPSTGPGRSRNGAPRGRCRWSPTRNTGGRTHPIWTGWCSSPSPPPTPNSMCCAPAASTTATSRRPSWPRQSKFREMGYRIDPWEGWAVTYIVLQLPPPHGRTAAAPGLSAPGPPAPHRPEGDLRGGLARQRHAHPRPGPRRPDGPQPLSRTTRRRRRALLTAHGWTDRGGTLRCTRPGQAAGECGAGIKHGQELRLILLSQSGSTETSNTMQAVKSALRARQASPSTSGSSRSTPCWAPPSPARGPNRPAHSGSSASSAPRAAGTSRADPSGEQIFATDAPSNMGNWSSPKTDRLIRDTAVLRRPGRDA